ncbi:uncharacterized protein LOC128863608 isoform X2 [Anastrepha ludens]|uniref:uncharacterized protein LOC128863608 isoform X2 n=1 Tax=Anastrepha ludens TaxID=28586 RepID=UPI0023AEE6FB|nr:uncharacterized protein LOC128863608 isoform X2 [Anastrepha ludens]
MSTTASCRGVIASEGNASAVIINMAEAVKTNDYIATSRKKRHDYNSFSEALGKKNESAKVGQRDQATEGLRRQPTKYPHGLNISIQAITNERLANSNSDLYSSCGYSQASTLCSSWCGNNNSKYLSNSNCNESISHTTCDKDPAPVNFHRKYRLSMLSKPENMAELQMRRFKYPLTDIYDLKSHDATSSKILLPLCTYLQHYGRWKYLRWPIILLTSTLLIFGLITYCIWLHDASVSRERYQRRCQKLNKDRQIASNEAQLISFVPDSVEVLQHNESFISTTTNITTIANENADKTATDHNQKHLSDSTILRAVNIQERQPTKEQKLTALEYVNSSKEVVTTDKDSHKKRDRDKDEPTPETTTYASAEAALVQTKVLHYGGYNGHQNSFGVPIDERQRSSRIFDEIFSSDQPFIPITKALTKVSPTIPPLTKVKPTHTMSSGFRTPAQDNGCYSTSLPICQGVLDYDLTYNSTTKMQFYDEKALQKLIESNCSMRALEFICVTLEPECRPSHIGELPPCRRICKAILEACSIVIANFDVLNELFDCGAYPDSSDPHKCEDPTRIRDYCYDNEFSCFDRSCIPHQWQCDNIKDCAAGEDEESCLVCDHQDEFRCRSNEKCVPESVRCDLKYDCFDGSDEEECDEYGSGEEVAASFVEAALNTFPRVFSYASFLSPNQTDEGLYSYITATTNNENSTNFGVHEITNRMSGISTKEITNNMPSESSKVNFRDSKEIMMTSDTENKFKYSSATTTPRFTFPNRGMNNTFNKVPFNAITLLKPAASMRVAITTQPSNPPNKSNYNSKAASVNSCAPHHLRCVSGECITVNQLCDKKIDCPDGADELMCVYKELRNSTTAPMRSSTARIESARTQSEEMSTTVRADKRSLPRTSIKRKAKA